jgi:hypothetical protein
MNQSIKLMSSVMEQTKGIKDKMERLASHKLTRESVNHILDRLFPPSADEKANQTRRNNTLIEVLGLYSDNDKNAFPSVQGTGYNLFNAITEYADHFRTARGNGSKPEQVAMARAESAMFGSGEKLKTQALTVILEEIDPETIASGISYLDK